MVTHWLQIPHFIWANDCFQHHDIICTKFHPVIDWLLYSVDLIEIPAIIVVTLVFIARYKNRK